MGRQLNLERILILLAVFSMLVACATPMQQADRSAAIQQANTPVKVNINVPFDEAQAKAAMDLGDATIRGVLYHKVTARGKYAGEDTLLTLEPAHYIKGVDVYLYPVTAHLNELLRLEKENRRQRISDETTQLKVFMPDDRIYKYALKSTTDEQGRYLFNKLRPGKYIVIAPNYDVSSRGTAVVRDGTSVVTNGIYAAEVAHYRTQGYNVGTIVEYEKDVEIKPNQKELTLESRMRFKYNVDLLLGL